MDKLKELKASLDAIDTKLDALLAHDELTTEQLAEHDQLVKDRTKAQAAIKREQDRLAREEERAKLDAEIAQREETEHKAEGGRGGKNVKTKPDQPNAEDVTGERKAKPFTIPATVKRFGSLSFFKGAKDGIDADVRAYRFGMWGLAQLSMQMPNRYRFKNAVDFFNENENRWATAHSSNNASGAHNLIPAEFGTDMIDLREQYGVVRRLFKKVPMASDHRTDPRRQGGLTAYFVAESGAGTESNKTWDNVGLTAKDLMVIARMSNQVNADSVINFGDDLMGEIVYAFTNKEDECGFNGLSTSTYGHIHGVCPRLQDVDGAGTDGRGLVTGAGNLYSELVLADFDKVVGRLPQFADTPNACWVMHRTFYYEVCERLVQASGGVPAYEVRAGERRPRPLLKGYPVEFSQVMPSTEANSQVCALLGDFAMGASFGDRQQDEIIFSEHATVGGESVFERNQIAVRGTERFDINVHGVGDASNAGAIVGLQTAAS